ncbi:UDP-N-acetylmuramoyl-tripeptide--D-alanyl-D-alanine ligase [Actinidia chinensis var. chinensis]|uniref:UDP-MurNAc-pentapeptide synthetase n=1 Tax=Actinidia chinensis var. chinensis TaxID=1590841 RepID=A0A2R6PH48_ACTCC|nr:UDP-N-acetylmuramoyl-tripeptide--D-alanyl-D-alanine ligase [Actinidia chinensis var. chinensis]
MSVAIIHSFPSSLTATVSLGNPPSKSNKFLTNLHPQVSPRKIKTRVSQISPPWTVSEIAEAINGRILKWGPPGTISIDTRTLEPGQWFLAITGQNFDAHDFVNPNLYDKGCIGVIGNRVCENWDKGFVHAEGNTLILLEKMADYARRRFHGCLIGLTGSVGKTTTRSMIALALEGLGLVHQSHGNWNNRIGVALSLIGIPRNAKMVVLELGMSENGEILDLARTCRPSVRVLLNVGPSHLENFRSLEDVSMAKGEILREAKPGDVCVLNADDPLVMSLPVPVGVKRVLFGRRMDCDVRLVLAESTHGGFGVRVVLERNKELFEFVISSPGLHLAMNACAAAAVATMLGASLPQVGRCLSRFIPVHMRLELEVAKSGIQVINDVYNANPVSTKAAIDMLEGISCKGKRVAILGDMLELGPTEMKSHEMILRHCCDAGFDLVALVGKRFLKAAENLDLARETYILLADDAESLLLEIVQRLNCNDVVLIKGSRAMKMEKVVDAIKALHS